MQPAEPDKQPPEPDRDCAEREAGSGAPRARAAQLEEELDRNRQELERVRSGLKYRLGDVLVRAARPSKDTLLLPVRLTRILADAVSLTLSRRRVEKRRRARNAPPQACGEANGAAGMGGLLASPFSEAPIELVRRPELTVAAVTDEFSWRAWQFEASLVSFTPNDWRSVFDARRPDLVLIESTWEGPGGAWRKQLIGKNYGGAGPGVLPEIASWCRRRDIPTVFYNKEDPLNFQVFIEAARECDYVFTSDSDCIAQYRDELRHDRVYALPFAAQPRIHNPVQTAERDLNVCFAGAWYARRHRSRREDADMILRPAIEFGLEILDRMAGSGDPDHAWPDLYKSHVRGGLPYEEMLAAYKRYKVFLNINSVSNSPTMFSRRVFELLACGTPVISSYSEGIEALLGDDIVPMCRDEESTRRWLVRLLEDENYRARLSLRGQRKVFSEHTYGRRLQAVLETIGMSTAAYGSPAMTMIAAVEAPGDIVLAVENYRRQSYVNRRLVLCTPLPDLAPGLERIASDDASISISVQSGDKWPLLLSGALRDHSDDYIIALNPSDWYGPHYLTDYANATQFVDRGAIGKAGCYRADHADLPVTLIVGAENRFTGEVVPWTLCLPRALASSFAQLVEHAETPAEWWRALVGLAGRVYAADRFNYVRGGANNQNAESTQA